MVELFSSFFFAGSSLFFSLIACHFFPAGSLVKKDVCWKCHLGQTFNQPVKQWVRGCQTFPKTFPGKQGDFFRVEKMVPSFGPWSFWASDGFDSAATVVFLHFREVCFFLRFRATPEDFGFLDPSRGMPSQLLDVTTTSWGLVFFFFGLVSSFFVKKILGTHSLHPSLTTRVFLNPI